jgi:hypothetical protein
MRTYKLMAAVASCAVLGTACAEDGKDGAVGPAGEKGDKGDQGDKGDTGEAGPAGPAGETGPAGADAPCAANPLLTITGVNGVADPVFPGAEAEFEIETDGGGDDVTVQFIGTAELLNGMATVPPTPTGKGGLFTVTPEVEGTFNYVAIATDGCSVATTSFTIEVRSALVSIVHIFPGAEDVGFVPRGEEVPLFQVVNGFFGPQAVATVPQGGTFPAYFRLAQNQLDLDLYPDLDLDGLPDTDAAPTPVPTLNLAPNDRIVVVAHADDEGALAFTVLNPDQSKVEGDANARFQFGHFASGVGPVDISTSDTMAPAIVSDAAFGSLSAGLLLPPLDYTVFVDADDDASPNFQVELPFETNQVLPGDYVLILAWLDAEGSLRIFNHDTGGDGTQYEGMIFPFEGDVTPILGPPDVTGYYQGSLETTSVLDIPLEVEADASCLVSMLTLDYDVTTMGDTYGTDIDYSLTAPDSTFSYLGNGELGAAGNEVGMFDASADFAEVAANGTWTLTVEDTWGDGVMVNSAKLNVYCAE